MKYIPLLNRSSNHQPSPRRNSEDFNTSSRRSSTTAEKSSLNNSHVKTTITNSRIGGAGDDKIRGKKNDLTQQQAQPTIQESKVTWPITCNLLQHENVMAFFKILLPQL